ncbi:MAG: choice-of-anchor Q domain-containing protein, partial [Mariniphaga sp.]
MLKKVEIGFCLFLLIFVKTVGGQTSHIITPDKIYLNGLDAAYQNIKPGDTLVFVSGAKNYLLIKNFHGAPGKPLVMINSGGPVIIDTDHYYGISIANCQYIKLTGTGDPSQTYGFQVKRVANGSGLGIGELSSDFEIDHVSIENCKIGGLYAKTDPDCSLTSVRGNFTQHNTIIHDNYVANVADEGMYIGSTKYDGQTVFCNGKDTVLMPSLLDGVRVYNNIVKYSGWDGIQVSSASKDCKIYNNTILFDSQAEANAQMSGIMIGGGTKCDCFNNFISQGKGDGIESHGLGGTRIFNNIILDAGKSYLPADLTQMKYGIYISDNDSSIYIENNNIVNPKSDGIRFASVTGNVNVIASNVIINPGNFDLYQNGNTWAKGVDSYIMRPDPGFIFTLQNNYLSRNADSVKFVSTTFQTPVDFKLLAGSPLIDHADADKNINFDFSGSPRPSGIKSDIGAFEFKSDTVPTPKPTSYVVIGGGSYCAGGTGLEIGLNSSQNGVSYELVLNGTKTGYIVNGTGTTISFGLQTAAGIYTAIGTDATTLVPNFMTGSASILVNPAPIVPDPILGNKSVCLGSTTTLTDAVTGGAWSSLTPLVATISTTGIVTSLTSGTATILYTVTNGSGCSSSIGTSVSVNPMPATPAPIGGNKSVCVGSTTTLTETITGGVWSSSAPTIATVSTSGVVKGIAAGTASIQYTITNGSGCKTSTNTNIIVDKQVSQPGRFTVYSSRVSQGQSNVTFSVPFVSDVTYNWNYSGLGATINGTGNSVQVSFSRTATSGNLNVTASNSCGTSIPRSIAISVSRLKDANLSLDSAAFSATGAFESLIEVAPVKNSLSVYPNPSLGETTFNMQIDKNAHVTLEIFTVSGKLAARVCDADLDAGVP